MTYHIDPATRAACVSALLDQLANCQYWLLETAKDQEHPRVLAAARTFVAGARALTELKHGIPQWLIGYDEAVAILDKHNHAQRR
jgi:hypothetical protein